MTLKDAGIEGCVGDERAQQEDGVAEGCVDHWPGNAACCYLSPPSGSERDGHFCRPPAVFHPAGPDCLLLCWPSLRNAPQRGS